MRPSITKGLFNHYWLFTIIVSLLFTISLVLEDNKIIALFFIPCIIGLFLIIKDFKIDYFDLILLMCFSAILIPPLKLSDSIPIIRPEFAMSLLVFPLIIYFKRETLNSNVKRFLIFYLGFMAIQLFSIFYGKYFHGVQTGYKDFVEVIRVGSYLLIVIVLSRVQLGEFDYRKLMWFILLIFFASALIGLFQYFSVLSFDSITAPLYSENRVWHVNTRMFGTFVNPNTYGTFISIGILLCVALMYHEKTISLKFYLFFIFLALFWTLVLTESRTALVTLFTGIVTYVLIYNIYLKGNLIASIRSIVVFAIIFIILFAVMSSALIDRFSTLLTFMEDPSWQMRLFAWYINFNLFLESWLFGFGPAFHQFTPTVDSDYILILRRYGIVGFTSYCLVYAILIKQAFKNLQLTDIYSHFKIFMISSFLIVLVGNITNPLFHEMQFMNFWAVMIGILLSIKEEKIKIEHHTQSII